MKRKPQTRPFPFNPAEWWLVYDPVILVQEDAPPSLCGAVAASYKDATSFQLFPDAYDRKAGVRLRNRTIRWGPRKQRTLRYWEIWEPIHFESRTYMHIEGRLPSPWFIQMARAEIYASECWDPRAQTELFWEMFEGPNG
jgi:hypothetical protein